LDNHEFERDDVRIEEMEETKESEKRKKMQPFLDFMRNNQ